MAKTGDLRSGGSVGSIDTFPVYNEVHTAYICVKMSIGHVHGSDAPLSQYSLFIINAFFHLLKSMNKLV